MVRLLSTLVLILSLLLFPPATLALISNNAVPGDTTYPIKRGLEDIIYAVASLNPTTRAWFSAARSDRRFKEFSTLIAQGKSASDTLNELVAQTQIAAEELKKVDDPIKKQELISQLSQSIDKYSQKLEEVVATPTPTTTPIPPVVSPPSDVTIPSPTAPPGSILTPQPSETLRPAPPSPTQAPSSPQAPVDQKDLDDAKEKLDDIKDKLDKEKKKSHQEKGEDKREDRKNDEKEKDKEKKNKDSDHDKKRD